MSKCATSQLCYGIDFGKETDLFPWDEINEDGEYIYNANIDDWWASIQDTKKSCPFEIINHGYDFSHQILSLSNSNCFMVDEGESVVILSRDLEYQAEQYAEMFFRLCEKYSVDIGDKHPEWLLSARYG